MNVASILAACVLATSVVGCSRSPEDDCAADRAALENVIARDQHVGSVLHDADGLAVSGKGTQAAVKIEKEARPEAQRARDEATQLRPRTRWGAQRRDDLDALIALRLTRMADYEAALRSDDLARVVGEMMAQRNVEQRAIELQKTMAAPIEARSKACLPP